MKRIELFLGTEKDKYGRGLFENFDTTDGLRQRREWIEQTRDYVARLFGGVSIKELDGAWFNGQKVVTERAVSIVFFIDDFEIEKAIQKTKDLAEYLCVFWNQEEVIWTATDVEFEAINPRRPAATTATGRPSTYPHIQNIPIGTPEARRIQTALAGRI